MNNRIRQAGLTASLLASAISIYQPSLGKGVNTSVNSKSCWAKVPIVLKTSSARWAQSFGDSVSAYGKWVFVSALYGGKSILGDDSVFVYKKDRSSWRLVQILRQKDGGLGSAMIVIAGRAFIKGYYRLNGREFNNVVFVYTKERDHWKRTDTITNAPGGNMVYREGQLIVGGAHSTLVKTYEYRRSTWVETQRISLGHGALVGSDMSASEKRLIVLAHAKKADGNKAGVVLVFGKHKQNWLLKGRILPSGKYNFLSCAISSNGRRIFVAVYKPQLELINKLEKEPVKNLKQIISQNERLHRMYHPQVLVYQKEDGKWKVASHMEPNRPGLSGNFGDSIRAVGTEVFVSAPNASITDNGYSNGAIYVFGNKGGGWLETDRLTAGHPSEPEGLGESFSVTGNFMFAGAPDALVRAQELGAVYIFHRG